ncbi:MAG: phage terminase large subunit [Clostridia bacterium]|nr:phage terminase large subunit [Clostridia bacterium]
MSGRVLKIGGVPSEKQREFFRSRAKYTAYGGARCGGKSWALRRKLMGLCLNYPGIRCLLVRRSLWELKANHVLPLLAEYGSIAKYGERDRVIELKNGSTIHLGYCATDSDTLRYQGQEYDIIAIDEATQLSEYQFSIFKASLRGVNSFPKRMYLTCNPGGVGHAWVKRLFIDRDFREGEDPADYKFIPALVYDNEVLLRSDHSYLSQLKALPKRLRDAWLDGRWDVFEGQFFPELSEEKHVIDVHTVPKNVIRYIAIDYGFDMLAVLLIAKDEGGVLYVERELMKKGLTLGEAAREIVRFIGDARVELAVASPDLWNRRQDSGLSGFEIMQSVCGMPLMVAADDRRVPGWRVLKDRLASETLFISRDCPELIASMQSLLCDREKIEDAASKPHHLTHAPEALRYAVMSRLECTRNVDEPLPFTFAKKGQSARGFMDF